MEAISDGLCYDADRSEKVAVPKTTILPIKGKELQL